MDKRIKMTEDEMCNYFIREQKVMEYGKEFFKDICGSSIITDSCMFVNDEILPLTCYNEMEEVMASFEKGDNSVITGGFVSACNRQAYIRIGIDTNNSILNKNLKRITRHEIIHYYLWLLGLPHNDNDLEFWCFCYVYDGGAYEELSVDNQAYYQLFVELYDDYVADLPWNVRHLVTGQMIVGISTQTYEQYSKYVFTVIDQFKQLFNRK